MLATTRGALLRGTTLDELGDEIDNNETPVLEYTEWAEQRRNFMPNPDMDRSASVGWLLATSSASALAEQAIGLDNQPVRRVTLTALTAGATSTVALYGARNRAEMPLGVLADVWTLGIRARASKPCLVTMSLGYGSGSSTTGAVATLALGTDEADYFADFTVGAAAAGVRLNQRLSVQQSASINPDLGVGDWIEYSRPLFTPQWAAPRFFRGDDGGTDLERYSWAGVPGVSASLYETRELVADYSDFPLSIIERETREQDPATNLWRTVRYFAGRVPSDLPVDDGDRIRDNRDGAIYAIDSFRREPRSLAGRASTTLKLRRTTP